MTKDELLDAVRRHDILFCLLHDKVAGDVIAANPKLRAVASMKITPSDIDVQAATARRTPVIVISPSGPRRPPTFTLRCCSRLPVAWWRATGWYCRHFPRRTSSNWQARGIGKVIGHRGGGRIGRAVAKRAHGFSMTILDPAPPARKRRAGSRALSCSTPAARRILFCFVHAPLTAENATWRRRKRKPLMTPTAFLIITSRGPMSMKPRSFARSWNGALPAPASTFTKTNPPDPAAHHVQSC